jgi:hypothetical protein
MLTDGKCNDPIALAKLMESQLSAAGEDIYDSEPPYVYFRDKV